MIFVVGPLIKIQKAVVVVDEQHYEFDSQINGKPEKSVLKALDFAFKVFFVLECHYPKTSSSLWHFIQNSAYDISVAGDRPNASVKVLVGLVKHALDEK